MKKTIKVGCRESVLALIQAEIVINSIMKVHSNLEFEVVPIKTTGDRILDVSLDEAGGKGLFIKELEQALLDRRIDIAVHSYKDMPFEETSGLPVVALSEREAPNDALVLPIGCLSMDKSKPIGSSSARRAVQFSRLYDGFEVRPIRGNVPTRISKLDDGEYSALILAQAGLNRLSLQDRISKVFTTDEMIPAGCQGIIAVQGRHGEDFSYLDAFHCLDSEFVATAERSFLRALESGCSSPVAVYARLRASEILLNGMFVSDDGVMEAGSISGSKQDACSLGTALGRRLLSRAGWR